MSGVRYECSNTQSQTSCIQNSYLHSPFEAFAMGRTPHARRVGTDAARFGTDAARDGTKRVGTDAARSPHGTRLGPRVVGI